MSEEATTEAEAKTFDAKITELGDSIASLTLKEAVDLADYMKDAYGIEPAAGGAVMMAGAGGGGDLPSHNNTQNHVQKNQYDIQNKSQNIRKSEPIFVDQ